MKDKSRHLVILYCIQNPKTLLWKNGYSSDLLRLQKRHPPEENTYVIVDSLGSPKWKRYKELVRQSADLNIIDVQYADGEWYSEGSWFSPDPKHLALLERLRDEKNRDHENAQKRSDDNRRFKEQLEETRYLQGGLPRLAVEHEQLLKGRAGCGCCLLIISPVIFSFALIAGIPKAGLAGIYLLLLLIGVWEEIKNDRANVRRIKVRLKSKQSL